MRILDIIWLPEIIEKIERKHHVIPEEVEDVLFGKPMFRKVQKGHIPGEDLYAALGQILNGRYLIILFVYKSTEEALVISARDMDNGERRNYENR